MGDKPNINHKGWQNALLFILPYLAIVAIFEVIGSFSVGVDPLEMDNEKTSFQELVLVFSSLVGALVALWIFAIKKDQTKFVDLGFHRKNISKEFSLGFGLGIFAIVSGYLLLIGLDEITYERVLYDPMEILISVLLFLFVSIAEESVFRGYFLRNLMISFNKYIALILSTILFTAAHAINPHINLIGVISLFCAGLLYGLTYMVTKNLWLPIALHFGWNLCQALLGFNVSGHDTYSLVEIFIEKNSPLNGGSFGFEGSIFSIIIQLLIFVGVLYFYRHKITNRSSIQ